MIPPTRYIDAGPGVPLANPQAAMAQGEAMARMGNTIAQVGETGFRMVERVRKIEEAGKMSALFSNMEEDAAKFSLELMKREDTEAWPAEWKARSEKWKDEARKVGLSPEAQAAFQDRYTSWNTQRSIGFETMAANKAIELGQARVSNSVSYLMGQGKFEEARREVRDWQASGGMDSPAADKALMGIDAQAAEYEMEETVNSNPADIVAADDKDLLDQFPGADLDTVKRAKRQASAKLQELRGEEMDALEAALMTGNLKQVDIEAAEHLTKKDRAALIGANAKADPPSNEEHANAWKVLSVLRDARDDAAVTPEQYREIWNEARGDVLRRIPSQWQGDLKAELSYLSPAGRSPDGGGGMGGPDTSEDLAALGRSAAFRARDAGVFGDVGQDAPYAVREKAHRKADQIRLDVKKQVAKHPEWSREEVMKFTDLLISGDTAAAASKMIPLVPGLGKRMRPLPGMEPGLPGSNAVLLPSKTAAAEAYDFIKP